MEEYWRNVSLKDIVGEVWKPVCGYEELYAISNFGRIKRLCSQDIHIWACGRRYKSRKKDRILAQKKHNRGYKMIALTKDKVKKYITIHRVVALSFIPNPENKRTINHINGIKWDNRVENLEWATDSENGVHSFKELGREVAKIYLGKFGKDHNRSKPVIQYDLSGNFVQEWENAQEIQRHKGWYSCNIQSVCTGQKGVHTAYGFKWKYKS